jgi:hypothetical protein
MLLQLSCLVRFSHISLQVQLVALLVQLVIVVNPEASKRNKIHWKSGLNWSALMFRVYWFRKGRLLFHLCDDDTWNMILEFECKTYWLLISPINLTTLWPAFLSGREEGGSICWFMWSINRCDFLRSIFHWRMLHKILKFIDKHVNI